MSQIILHIGGFTVEWYFFPPLSVLSQRFVFFSFFCHSWHYVIFPSTALTKQLSDLPRRVFRDVGTSRFLSTSIRLVSMVLISANSPSKFSNARVCAPYRYSGLLWGNKLIDNDSTTEFEPNLDSESRFMHK